MKLIVKSSPNVVAIRTYYVNNLPAGRNYMIRGWSGELIPAYRAEPGVCEIPPPSDNGGGQ